MTGKVVVIIFGNMASGKSTMADMFGELPNVRTINLADPLKEITSIMIGVPLRILYGSQADKTNCKVYGKSVRHWLQWLGTDVARENIDPCIWTDRLVDRINKIDESIVVVGDGRFPQEELTGLVERVDDSTQVIGLRIKRPGNATNTTNKELAHASESVVSGTPDEVFDYIINNNGTLSELRRMTSDIYDDIVNHAR